MAHEPDFQGGTAEAAPPADAGNSLEQQLVSAVLSNDRKAAAQLISDHADSVYGYVHHRLSPRHDVVEDMVQDVFLAALQSLAHFRGESSLRAWLLGIARHKVEDFYRRQLRAPGVLDDDAELAGDGPLPDEVIDRQREGIRTQTVLHQMPEPYRFALLWRYWENRSVREIAETTGKTEKAIERMLARARARFRTLWDQSKP